MKTFWTKPGQGAKTSSLMLVLDYATKVHKFPVSCARAHLQRLGEKQTNLAMCGGIIERYDITRIENCE